MNEEKTALAQEITRKQELQRLADEQRDALALRLVPAHQRADSQDRKRPLQAYVRRKTIVIKSAKARQKRAERQKAMYLDRKAMGVCVYCCGDLGGRKLICQSCRDKGNARLRAKYSALKQAGLCTTCQKPSERGLTLCVECNEKNNKRMKESRSQNT